MQRVGRLSGPVYRNRRRRAGPGPADPPLPLARGARSVGGWAGYSARLHAPSADGAYLWRPGPVAAWLICGGLDRLTSLTTVERAARRAWNTGSCTLLSKARAPSLGFQLGRAAAAVNAAVEAVRRRAMSAPQ